MTNIHSQLNMKLRPEVLAAFRELAKAEGLSQPAMLEKLVSGFKKDKEASKLRRALCLLSSHISSLPETAENEKEDILRAYDLMTRHQ